MHCCPNPKAAHEKANVGSDSELHGTIHETQKTCWETWHEAWQAHPIEAELVASGAQSFACLNIQPLSPTPKKLLKAKLNSFRAFCSAFLLLSCCTVDPRAKGYSILAVLPVG